MRAWELEGYNAELEYERLHGWITCWACGAWKRQENYFAPWMIERAHIVNKPRRLDRRLVVMLCSVCHRISHGERLSGFDRSKLELAHLLTLKKECDPDWWDLEFIQRHSIRILPELEPLPFEYRSAISDKKGRW